jgi:hypothetical protein
LQIGVRQTIFVGFHTRSGGQVPDRLLKMRDASSLELALKAR